MQNTRHLTDLIAVLKFPLYYPPRRFDWIANNIIQLKQNHSNKQNAYALLHLSNNGQPTFPDHFSLIIRIPQNLKFTVCLMLGQLYKKNLIHKPDGQSCCENLQNSKAVGVSFMALKAAKIMSNKLAINRSALTCHVHKSFTENNNLHRENQLSLVNQAALTNR